MSSAVQIKVKRLVDGGAASTLRACGGVWRSGGGSLRLRGPHPRARLDRGGPDRHRHGVSLDPRRARRGSLRPRPEGCHHTGRSHRSRLSRRDSRRGDESRGATAAEIKPGDRIAQLRIVQRIEADFTEVEELGEAARGAGGFGSTGSVELIAYSGTCWTGRADLSVMIPRCAKEPRRSMPSSTR